MFYPIIIIFKCTSCIVRWIDIDTLDFPRKILLQRLKCNQIVSVNQHILAVRITV